VNYPKIGVKSHFKSYALQENRGNPKLLACFVSVKIGKALCSGHIMPIVTKVYALGSM
jgi:hypothetical protein